VEGPFCIIPEDIMISTDQQFLFDNQGYLHLRGALSAEEVHEYLTWVEQAAQTDIHALNEDSASLANQLNRPVSRIIDADLRFARFLDHPQIEPYLATFLGAEYRHIDNDLYFTHPGYRGGDWHRGVQPHVNGHVVQGQFCCPMIKVFFCLTDVGPEQGAFVVIPGSHKSNFQIDEKRLDLPGQHIFDTVQAGDCILFNEALIHTGRPNPSEKTRKTIIMNFGRSDAGPWPGYAPKAATLAAISDRQRQILTPASTVWQEPVLAGS
jgi:ectoine hydroxylase-related dioxygenase (phytanoyl-CoA dioxygenase family)